MGTLWCASYQSPLPYSSGNPRMKGDTCDKRKAVAFCHGQIQYVYSQTRIEFTRACTQTRSERSSVRGIFSNTIILSALSCHYLEYKRNFQRGFSTEYSGTRQRQATSKQNPNSLASCLSERICLCTLAMSSWQTMSGPGSSAPLGAAGVDMTVVRIPPQRSTVSVFTDGVFLDRATASFCCHTG